MQLRGWGWGFVKSVIESMEYGMGMHIGRFSYAL